MPNFKNTSKVVSSKVFVIVPMLYSVILITTLSSLLLQNVIVLKRDNLQFLLLNVDGEVNQKQL